MLVPASGFCCLLSVVCFVSSDVKTWQRPTLPRLETEYHWRGGFSRPSSGWDRVRTPRYGHQVVEPDDVFRMKLGRKTEDDWFCVRASFMRQSVLEERRGGVRPHARDL